MTNHLSLCFQKPYSTVLHITALRCKVRAMENTTNTQVMILTPHAETLTQTWHGQTLAHLQHAIGGAVDVISLAHGLDVWVHDEGPLAGLMINRPASQFVDRYLGNKYPICGTVVFTGHDGEQATSLPEAWQDTIAQWVASW